jgi:hypothetical protein
VVSASVPTAVKSQLEDALAAMASWRKDPSSAAIVKTIVQDELPALLKPWLTGHGLELKGSTGQGSTTDTPWVGIFPAGESSAKHGSISCTCSLRTGHACTCP